MPDSSQYVTLSASVTPSGHIHVEAKNENLDTAPVVVPLNVGQQIIDAFLKGNASGFLQLVSSELTLPMPATLNFWRDFSRLFFTHLCALPNLEDKNQAFELLAPISELSNLLTVAPPMHGGEYLNSELLRSYWQDLSLEVKNRLSKHKGSAADFIHTLNPAWNLVGRVCFHLAENKQDPEQPFAFLATYTNRLSAMARAQHLPLGRAIQEFSGASNRNALITLLKPVQKAAENSPWLKKLVDEGEIFHPRAWSANEAYKFLKEIPTFEAAGVVVRVPDWWQTKRPPRPEIRITVGKKKPSDFGLDALLDFEVACALEGEALSKEEWEEILHSTSNLISLRGHWVEVDRDKLQEALAHWRKVQKTVVKDGVSFADAMRLLASASSLGGKAGLDFELSTSREWSHIVAGDWLAQTIDDLRNPDAREEKCLATNLKATLRPYQQAGVKWMWLMHRLRLGACLADDMGLGKTIQVLALILLLKEQKPSCHGLLVVPASLIGNWLAEAEKFAPSLKFFVLHPSSLPSSEGEQDFRVKSEKATLTITTYALLSRFRWLAEMEWDVTILDEAQAIKNPGAKQTAAVKAIKASQRIALSGTPIENRPSDLWSIFDFICPGLLGTSKVFSQFLKQATNPYSALRGLIQPYILRRLKTDRSIIADLPEKVEVLAYCTLSKVQAALYEKAVTELARKIEQVEGIQRRGVILSFLIRFKQICNHPSHWLGDNLFEAQASGKFIRLAEICEEIVSRQEKVLIFTQFREMIDPLAKYLSVIFGREGLVLHGETPVKKRKSLVDAFQDEHGPPFFILSLKAGGTGLNLTAASHVIHFDRWWNPAVENQATDRAFRIGQRRNVLVHKLLCRGTLEEKIDAMIEAKKAIATELLTDGSSEALLTELSNVDLIKLVSLDIHSAMNDV